MSQVDEARNAVSLALQTYGLAVRYKKQTLPAWDAVQEKIDALIAAVREELHEEYAFAVLSASSLSAAREHCERVAKKHLGEDLAKAVVCEWTHEEAWDADIWQSSCGEEWVFIAGGPLENGAKFCHNCGKPVKVTVVPITEEEE